MNKVIKKFIALSLISVALFTGISEVKMQPAQAAISLKIASRFKKVTKVTKIKSPLQYYSVRK